MPTSSRCKIHKNPRDGKPVPYHDKFEFRKFLGTMPASSRQNAQNPQQRNAVADFLLNEFRFIIVPFRILLCQ